MLGIVFWGLLTLGFSSGAYAWYKNSHAKNFPPITSRHGNFNA